MLQVWNLIQIREITHTIVGVTEGDFTTNVSVTGNDEVTFTIRDANDVASNMAAITQEQSASAEEIEATATFIYHLSHILPLSLKLSKNKTILIEKLA